MTVCYQEQDGTAAALNRDFGWKGQTVDVLHERSESWDERGIALRDYTLYPPAKYYSY
jgi:hypothetical protein